MVAWVTRYVTEISTIMEGVHGIAHHVRARPPLDLGPIAPPAGIQLRLPMAGEALVSTLNNAARILQTSSILTLSNRTTRVNRIASFESWSFSASVPISRPKPATRMRRRRPVRSCRARETTLVQVSVYEEAHGSGRHTGWQSFERGMSWRF